MKAKILSLALCAALVVSLLAGCSGGGASSSPPASRANSGTGDSSKPTSSGITVTFTNESDYIFNEIYLSPNESDEWGSDLLGGTNILKSGGSHDITLESASNGLYDIQAIDEDGDKWQFERVPLEKGSTVVIYGDGTAVSTSPGGVDTTVQGNLITDSLDDDPVDSNWIEFTFYNDSSYDFEEIYVFEEGVTDESLIGYNHIEEHGTLISMGSTGIGVDNYEYFDAILMDSEGDGWYFQGVNLQEGCDVSIYIDEDNDPTLEVSYADGSGTSYYYGEFI